jgi:hypothetical protein
VGIFVHNVWRLALDQSKIQDMISRTEHSIGDPKQTNTIQTFRPKQTNSLALKDRFVQELRNAVNIYMPGEKYLIATDMANTFTALIDKVDYEAALMLLGIPDRWYLYLLERNFNIPYIKRGIINQGKRIKMEDSELIDFLRRINATYGIFKIRTATCGSQ